MSALFSGVRGTIAKGALFVGFSAFLLDQSVYSVPAGNRAIVMNRFSIPGVGDKGLDVVYPRPEGLNFKLPYFQYVPLMVDVRTKPKTISTDTGTKDLQTVKLSLRLLYRPKQSKVGLLVQKRGSDYANRILPSIGNEVLKAIVAQYNAEQLMTQREEVSRKIRKELTKQCGEWYIILEDVSITHLSFSQDFMRAIEDKQVQEQRAEKAKFLVAKSEQEKKALVIKSEGDAEAARIVAEATSKYGTGLLEIRRIETAMSVADTLARSRGNVTYLPGQNNGQNNNSGILLSVPTQ